MFIYRNKGVVRSEKRWEPLVYPIPLKLLLIGNQALRFSQRLWIWKSENTQSVELYFFKRKTSSFSD